LKPRLSTRQIAEGETRQERPKTPPPAKKAAASQNAPASNLKTTGRNFVAGENVLPPVKHE